VLPLLLLAGPAGLAAHLVVARVATLDRASLIFDKTRQQ
jgi:hypothetical protein